MSKFKVSSSDHTREFLFAIFGPQITHWTRKSLADLQSTLSQDSKLEFLLKTFLQLPSLWETFKNDFGIENFVDEQKLKELADFAAGRWMPNPQDLSNTHLSPLTIASQMVDLLRNLECADGNDSLFGFQVVQGFCTGFLSAAAISSSHSWADFTSSISNALRLAVCIGAIIDAEDESHVLSDRATAVSVSWKSAADRGYLETSLDLFPDAYISCITDERALTITLPNRDQTAFSSRLSAVKLSTTVIGLGGGYHHSRHAKAAQALKQLCAENSELKLPNADKLRLPLRSTSDADIITSGALHDIAIDSILCKRAHWSQTVKLALASLPASTCKFVTFGKESCVPRCLSSNTRDFTNEVPYHNDLKDFDRNPEEVAVVGMACRFPGANSVEEFWHLLSSGRTSIGELPIERFNSADISRKPNLANYWGNFLKQHDVFDHRFFGISGREAKSMDPQQRLALQVAYEALESSGYLSLPATKKHADVGCYLGIGSVEYEDNITSTDANAFSATGTLRAFISGRISHFFGWTGPSITFDTACSSSAVAIHSACKAILTGECSMALAGGVNIITSPNLYQNLFAASFLNPNGSSMAFDAAASGYCRGEGIGLILLKPLSRAIANGDTVLGTIAGSALNQNSNCTSITVPHSQSQSSLYNRALTIGRINPNEVTYVEAHGTGTPVGDPIEYESVRMALTSPRRQEELFLGSVKDNIGHTEAASGAAAVIKTLLMIQHKTIPKQANFVLLNSSIKTSDDDKITIPKVTQPWTTRRRIALINNYGAAGSNAAIVLREHLNDQKETPAEIHHIGPPTTYSILLAAKSATSLLSCSKALKSYLHKSEASLASIAYSLARRQNPSFEHRIAFTASDIDKAISILNNITTNANGIITQTAKLPVVLCFGGQTGRNVTVSRHLYDNCEIFRHHLNECDAAYQSLELHSIFPGIFQDDPIEDMVALHCMLFSLQVSCAKSWIDSGLEVNTVIGHSFGQFAALCVADSISLKDAFRLVSGRARLIQDSWGPERGLMSSVECEREEIEAVTNLVNSTGDFRLDIACYNGPRSFVLAGNASSIEAVEKECRAFKTTRLQSTHAYHSYLVDAILSRFRKLVQSINIQPPRIHVETCSTNENWPVFTTEEIVQHTRKPVYFNDAVDRIAARLSSAVWLEAGSASPIVAMARRILRKYDRFDTFLPIRVENSSAMANLADAASEMWKAGCPALYWPFHYSRHGKYENLNLPPYQFEETRHWIPYKPKIEVASAALTQNQISKERSFLKMIKNGGAKGEYLFIVNTSNEFFDLAGRGHAVTGRGLCPASMYIEMAVTCASSIPGTSFGTGTLPHIEGLTMSMPLGVGSDSSVFIRIRESAEGAWDFAVLSHASTKAGSEDSGTEHARGIITSVSTRDVIAENRLKLLKRFARSNSIDRVLDSRSSTGVSGPLVYKLFSEVVEYAKYYHGVSRVSAFENEAVGFVSVPKDRPCGMHIGICDPISLDNFLQVAGIHVNCLTHRNDKEVFMCVAVEEIIFTESFTTNKSNDRSWTVYSRYERTSKNTMSIDIFVHDASSRDLVLAMVGVIFKGVPFKSLARNLAKLDAINTTTRNMSDNESDQDIENVKDSGYQTRLPTPPIDEDLKQSPTRSTYLDQALVTPDPNRTKVQESLNMQPGHDNLILRLREMFSDIMEIPIQEIESTSAMADLGIDSLLVNEVLIEIKKRFKIEIATAQFSECSNILSLAHLLQPNQTVQNSSQPVQRMEKIASRDTVVDKYCPSTPDIYDKAVVHEEQTRDSLAVVSRDCFVQAKGSYDQHAEITGFVNFNIEAFPLQSELVTQYVVEAFASLGCDLQDIPSGHEVPTIQYDDKHQKLIPQLYKILEDAKLLEIKANGTFYRTATKIPTSTASTLHAKMLDKFPKHTSETKLLHTTASKLADCVSGTTDPIALLFGNSASRMLLEDVYTNAPMFKTGTLLLAQYLSSVMERLNGDREIRILELGAGTGGTTSYLVDTLARLETKGKLSYTFSDLSSSLVAVARRKFAKWTFMQYIVVDVENDPESKLIDAYDIIISTNCVHATKNLVQSTTNIRKMLRADGVLCLVELTRNLFWFDLVFGLLEGWWLFNDGRKHALAHERFWEQCLHAAGFKWVDWSDTGSNESDILRVITASPFEVIPSAKTIAVDNFAVKNSHETRKTVVYKEIDGLKLLADIYYPPVTVELGRKIPVALMIHGGGYIMLSRNDIRPKQTDLLLRSGFLPVSVDYRLCPETTLSEGPMTDIADALAWIKKVLPKLSLDRTDIHVDVEKVVTVGWSTGGHLAMSLAWTSALKGVQPPAAILALYCPTDYEDSFWTQRNIPSGSETTTDAASASVPYDLDDTIWAGLSDQPIASYNIPSSKRALGGWLAPSDPRSRLALHMNWHGRTLHVLLNGLDKTTRCVPSAPEPTHIAAVSPLARIRKGEYRTPTFIIHPRQDDLIPWQQAQRTWEALRAAGIDADLRIVEDAPHLFDVYPAYQDNDGVNRSIRDGYEFLCRHVGLTLPRD